jgi:sentrin-specific protease 1
VGQTHWALGVVDFKLGKVAYWDSLGAEHKNFGSGIIRYLKDEWEDKKVGEFPYDLRIENDADVPTQHNSYDCGVFTCMFAEAATRKGAVLDFAQDDIEDCRLLIVSQIVRGSIERV